LVAAFYGGTPIELEPLFALPTLLDPSISPGAWKSEGHRATMIAKLKAELKQLAGESDDDHATVHNDAYQDPSLAIVTVQSARRAGRPPSSVEWGLYEQVCVAEQERAAKVTWDFVRQHSDAVDRVADSSHGARPELVNMTERMYLNDFWKKHRETFPLLFQLFRRYSALPSGGAASESQFSVMGHLLSPRRMSTTASHAQDRTIVKCFFMTLPAGQTLESMETSVGIPTGALGQDGGVEAVEGEQDAGDSLSIDDELVFRNTFWEDY